MNITDMRTTAKETWDNTLYPFAVGLSYHCQQKIDSAIQQLATTPEPQESLSFAFVKNFAGSLGSLLPQNIKPYLQFSSCLAGASAFTSEMVYHGIHGMEGVVDVEKLKPLSAEVAGQVGHLLNDTTSCEKLREKMSVENLSPPIARRLAAEAWSLVLKQIKPKAGAMVTATSTATGTLNFLTGVLTRAALLTKNTDASVQKVASRTAEIVLAACTGIMVFRNYHSASRWGQFKQLAGLAVIGKFAYAMKDQCNAMQLACKLALPVLLPKETALTILSATLLAGGVSGGILGALQSFATNHPELLAWAKQVRERPQVAS